MEEEMPDGGDREAWLEIPLTQGKVALIDAADFGLVGHVKWFAAKSKNIWYAHHSGWNGTRPFTIRMHRIIAGAGDGQRVDHWDGDGLNNRWRNLRFGTAQQNSRNAGKHRVDASSSFKGVTLNKKNGRWHALICDNYKLQFLGAFGTEEEAAIAYDRAARNLFGEFARTNFPETSPCP